MQGGVNKRQAMIVGIDRVDCRFEGDRQAIAGVHSTSFSNHLCPQWSKGSIDRLGPLNSHAIDLRNWPSSAQTESDRLLDLYLDLECLCFLDFR